MRQATRYSRSPNRNRHSLRIGCAILALHLGIATGCEEEVADQFRDAAATSLEAGFKQIFDGLIEGAFAAFVVGTQDEAAADG